MISRKEFLMTTGAALTLGGCSAIPPALRPGWRAMTPEAGPFLAPSSDSVDLVSHVLSRLTFGPRGADYGRVAGLARTPEEAVHAYIEQQLDPERIDDSRIDRALRRLEVLSEP